jgi:(1->4)-alpha-D-glucan 1-alpha-D-glucosylmutase
LVRHDASTPPGRQNLHALLEKQHYRLAWWRCAADEINWRRFFEINDLIGIRIENNDVFDAVHALPLRLFEQGLIDGLRIDHIDGLADPLAYCRRLRAALEQRRVRRPTPHNRDPAYLVVEKILAHDETVDARWGVHGTTGYDFMDQAGALLHDPDGQEKLTLYWERLSGEKRTSEALLEDARILILRRHLAAERSALIQALHQLARASPATRDCSAVAIGRVLDQLLVLFQGYRTYVDAEGSSAPDTQRLNRAVDKARARLSIDHDSDDTELLSTIALWLSGEKNKPPDVLQDTVIRRFQQLSSSLAAKSLEDTAFYRYGRLLSRNEVGSDLTVFALTPGHFHRHGIWRAAHAPASMLATATHDHKRGEDMRARLAVLSEMPDMWTQTVIDWMVRHSGGRTYIAETLKSLGQRNANAFSPVLACPLPHPADRYMLYQTLIGAWPLDLDARDDSLMQTYTQRVEQWQIKALREAKLRSSWVAPNLEYEAACTAFLKQLMRPHDDAAPRYELALFVQKIARAGAINGLVQTFLRLTVPGVPDLYQGTEFWDFSLADPDNRQAVDFDALTEALNQATPPQAWRNGHIKQTLIRQCLLLRREYLELFTHGNYEPLRADGSKKTHVIAFLRQAGPICALIVAMRLPLSGCRQTSNDQPGLGIAPHWWEDTIIRLPADYAGSTLVSKLDSARITIGPNGIVPLHNALSNSPVGLFMLDQR